MAMLSFAQLLQLGMQPTTGRSILRGETDTLPKFDYGFTADDWPNGNFVSQLDLFEDCYIGLTDRNPRI